jgi:hypothetical protein
LAFGVKRTTRQVIVRTISRRVEDRISGRLNQEV